MLGKLLDLIDRLLEKIPYPRVRRKSKTKKELDWWTK